MKKKILALLAMSSVMIFGLAAFGGVAEATGNAGKAPDYSQKASWYKMPEITKDVDTFYIYATEYILGSFEDGAPDYATLDNAEMLAGVPGEYMTQASVYEDSTNVFLPYYRQAGLRFAGEIHKKTGDVNAALYRAKRENRRA